LNATWKSQAPTVRARFDAAVPGALTEVAETYRRLLVTRLGETFVTEDARGQIAGSVRVSKVGGTSAFRVRVFSRHFLARLWELGWRHWRTGTVGQRGKRKYTLFTRRYRRQVWRPVLYGNIRTLRKLFRDRMDQAVGRRGGGDEFLLRR
jgi:hypothetical protein